MPWQKKRKLSKKAPSRKVTKRRKATSSYQSKKKRKPKGKSYKFTRATARKVSMMTAPAPIRTLDVLRVKYQVAQSTGGLTGFGAVGSSGTATPYSFTASPLDPYMLAWGIINGAGASGFSVTGTRLIISDYEYKYEFGNPSSLPVRITSYSCYCHSDVPVIDTWGQAADYASGAGTVSYVPQDICFEAMYSRTNLSAWTKVAGLTQATTLTAINPIAPNTADPSGGTTGLFLTHPGWKPQDNPWFNRHFKVKGVKTRVIKPNGFYIKTVKSKKPRTISAVDILDNVETTAHGSNKYGMRVQAFKGSWIYLFQIEGLPLVNNASTTALSECWLNLVQTRRMTTRVVMNNQAQMSLFNSYTGNTAGYTQYLPTSSIAAPIKAA